MRRVASRLGMMVMLTGAACGQEVAPAPATASQAGLPAAPSAVSGGTIKGSVKAGAVPLPGVGVTATNTLTGKKYATTTDVEGSYGLAIPRNGRYVVKVELAAFASLTKEVVVNAAGENGGSAAQVADFGMQLASRVAAEAASGQVAAGTGTGRGTGGFGGASALRRGVQSLEVTGADELAADASAGGDGECGGADAYAEWAGGCDGLGGGEWAGWADEWVGKF